MAKPYDNDLRQKVIQAIEQDGLPKGEASKLFRISRNRLISGLNGKQKQAISSLKNVILVMQNRKLGI